MASHRSHRCRPIIWTSLGGSSTVQLIAVAWCCCSHQLERIACGGLPQSRKYLSKISQRMFVSLSYGSPCCPPTGLGQVGGYNRASQTRGWCSSGIKIISSPKNCSNNSPVLKSAASAMASSGMSLPSIRATFNGVPRLHSSAVQFLMSRVKFGNEWPPCTSPLTSLEDEIAHSVWPVRSDRNAGFLCVGEA